MLQELKKLKETENQLVRDYLEKNNHLGKPELERIIRKRFEPMFLEMRKEHFLNLKMNKSKVSKETSRNPNYQPQGV
jgi:hypothetical protein